MKHLYILLISLLTISCVSNNKITLLSDVESTTVEFTPYDDLSHLIGVIGIDNVANGLLLSLHKQDHCYSFYNFETKHTTTFAPRGKGPNEFIAPLFCGQVDPKNPYKIRILDRAKKDMSLFL